MKTQETLKIALLGCGTVGSSVARILREDAQELAQRTGARLELASVVVRDTSKTRQGVSPELITDDAEAAIQGADIVVELMGGIEPAGSLISQAMSEGKTVVTANKALVAERIKELSETASSAQVQLSYEAAVAGAIPILRPIRDSLAGDRITKVMGIVNGTTNFILDAMETEGSDFASTLKRAQDLGYAEADPTADVEGLDAAAKASILASLSFHTNFPLEKVYVEGISGITDEDIRAAKAQGYRVKLLAIAERVATDDGDRASVRVHPTLVHESHPLAAVRGAYNAVFVEAENAGDLMFYGQGAGGNPTASAVMGDLVSAARRVVAGGPGRTERVLDHVAPLDFGQSLTSYCVGVTVFDAPGVLAHIAEIFARHGQSIASMTQTANDNEDTARLRFLTHQGKESDLKAVVEEIHELDVVASKPSFIRVEGRL